MRCWKSRSAVDRDKCSTSWGEFAAVALHAGDVAVVEQRDHCMACWLTTLVRNAIVSNQFFSALFQADVFGEHLLEGFHEVRICILHGITNPATIKLPAPMPSYPFAIGSAVHRTKHWTVFSDVD
jgi:hypothetical protein